MKNNFQIIKVLGFLLVFLCSTNFLFGQRSKTIQFKYEQDGQDFSGSVLLNAQKIVIDGKGRKSRFGPGDYEINLSCSSEECYVEFYLSNLKWAKSSHDENTLILNLDDFAKRAGLSLLNRGDELRMTKSKNIEPINYAFEKNGRGSIDFMFKVEANGKAKYAKHLNSNKKTLFQQKYRVGLNEEEQPIIPSSVSRSNEKEIAMTKETISKPKNELKPRDQITENKQEKTEKSNTSKETSSWEQALEAHSFSAYKAHNKQYPNGQYYQEVLDKVEQLVWERELAKLSDEQSPKDQKEILANYLNDYPNGIYLPIANKKIDSILWSAASDNNVAFSYSQYLSESNDLVQRFKKYEIYNLDKSNLEIKTFIASEDQFFVCVIENTALPIEKAMFQLPNDEIKIAKIEGNKIYFSTNAENTYPIIFTDKRNRISNFSITSSKVELNAQLAFDSLKQQINFSEIVGGEPPYFIQFKNEFFTSRQFDIGSEPNHKFSFKGKEELPKGYIDVYLTDANKSAHRYLGIVKVGSQKSFNAKIWVPVFSVLSLFSLIGFIILKRKRDKEKVREW